MLASSSCLFLVLLIFNAGWHEPHVTAVAIKYCILQRVHWNTKVVQICCSVSEQSLSLCTMRKPEAAQCFIKGLSRIMGIGGRKDQNMERQSYWSESIAYNHDSKMSRKAWKATYTLFNTYQNAMDNQTNLCMQQRFTDCATAVEPWGKVPKEH